MTKSAAILLGFLVFLELSCASNDDDGGGGGGADARPGGGDGGVLDAPRLPDARPLPDGYMLPDGFGGLGDGGFMFGDGGFGGPPCASNDDCEAASCCLPFVNICIEGARDPALGYCSFM